MAQCNISIRRRFSAISIFAAAWLTGCLPLYGIRNAAAQAGVTGQIVFVANLGGNDNHDVYVIDADGSKLTRLTTDPAYENSPEWSPDGKQIAFASDRTNSWEIYVMNIDGTDQRQVTSYGINEEPHWSPDGTKIAYVSTTDQNK